MALFKRKTLLLIFITAVLRLFIIGNFGLGDDEAHYWKYSAVPSLSYYDHPPLSAWLIAGAEKMFGHNEFAVRFPAVIIFAASSWLVYLIGLELFFPAAAFLSVVFLNIIPVFTLLGAVLMVPDSPLAFFWLLYILVFVKILNRPDRKWLWYVSGAVLGLALLSKYNAVFIPLGAFLVLALTRSGRKLLREKEFYLSLLIGFVFFSPVILWNLQNGFASFGFQLGHGFSQAAKFDFARLGKSLGAQSGYISPFIMPWLFFLMACAAYDLYRRRDRALLTVLSFSVPIMFFFNVVAGFKEILPHWPAMGYLTAVYLLAYYDFKYREKKPYRIFRNFSCGFAVFLSLLVVAQLLWKLVPVHSFLPAEKRNETVYGVTRGERADITNELFGYPAAARAIDRLVIEKQLKNPFILTHRHYIASQISFYNRNYEVFCINDRYDQYDWWQRGRIPGLKGRDAVFITDNRFSFEPEKNYLFEKFRPYIAAPVFRSGVKVREFRLTECRNFSGISAESQPQDEKGARDAVVSFDRQLFLLLNRTGRSRVTDIIFAVLSILGEGYSLFLVGSFFILRKACRELRGRGMPLRAGLKVAFLRSWPDILFMGGIMLFTGFLGQLLKSHFDRLRPAAFFNGREIFLNFLVRPISYRSFPSGHAIAAFTLAVFIGNRLKNLAFPVFVFAFFVAYSRVYNAVHYPLDTVFGALLGIFITLAALWVEKKIRTKQC